MLVSYSGEELPILHMESKRAVKAYFELLNTEGWEGLTGWFPEYGFLQV